MRMSCNGCRVLRKGCSEGCTIRPCLQWIKSPESQANATVFLAKFYGRAGLLNLINAGPEHLRPAIFRSLLYEACGRIVNPVYGSAGLLWSGSWHLCQAAVEAVLSGAPIVQVSSDSAVGGVSPPLKACDIRHVSRDESSSAAAAAAGVGGGDGSPDARRVRSRSRAKRSAASKPKPMLDEDRATADFFPESTLLDGSAAAGAASRNLSRQPSHGAGDSDSVSVETVEASLMKADDHDHDHHDRTDGSDLELELTLGLEPPTKFRRVGPVINGSRDATCKAEIALDLPA